jgi:hypothetical protein
MGTRLVAAAASVIVIYTNAITNYGMHVIQSSPVSLLIVRIVNKRVSMSILLVSLVNSHHKLCT